MRLSLPGKRQARLRTRPMRPFRCAASMQPGSRHSAGTCPCVVRGPAMHSQSHPALSRGRPTTRRPTQWQSATPPPITPRTPDASNSAPVPCSDGLQHDQHQHGPSPAKTSPLFTFLNLGRYDSLTLLPPPLCMRWKMGPKEGYEVVQAVSGGCKVLGVMQWGTDESAVFSSVMPALELGKNLSRPVSGSCPGHGGETGPK